MQRIVYAKFNKCGIPPYKVKLVADLIRNKKALAACDILKFTNKSAAKDVLKVVESAIANAVNNDGMDKKELTIVKVAVDFAPTFKRGRAVARGRYHEILKRNSHITIGVSDGSEVSDVKKTVKKVKEEIKIEDKKEAKKEVKPVVKKETKAAKSKLTKKPIIK